MKGATIGHSKQRIRDGRYIGLTEPGIIAAEPPNAIVNQLVIMPDIEKRLEAFVRIGHGIVVFPGGAGTAEEILYLLGILLDPGNERAAVPGRVHRARRRARSTSRRSTRSSAATLGAARAAVLPHRRSTTRPRSRARCCAAWTRCASSAARRSDAYNFNWLLRRPARAAAAVRADARGDGGARAAPRHGRRTCWRRTCAARSPASSPATSRSTGIRLIEERGPVRDPRRRRAARSRSTRCSRRSCASGA